MNEKKLFMEGEKLVVIISEAGSAGFTLHADKRVRNQVIKLFGNVSIHCISSFFFPIILIGFCTYSS
jgi:hypothetical protein